MNTASQVLGLATLHYDNDPLVSVSSSASGTHREALTPHEVKRYSKQLPTWKVYDSMELRRTVKLENFLPALRLAAQLKSWFDLIERPVTIQLEANSVKLTLCTPGVFGLTREDFELAAEIDAAFRLYPAPVPNFTLG